MELASPERITIQVDGPQAVSGLWLRPAGARACLVLAHGAGAGMAHPSLATLARDLAEGRVATLRYQFPYMEHGRRRPDPPAIAHATVRAAVDAAARLASGLPLFAGGRSFGARMTSQAQATSALPGVRGLVFFAFPLHPANCPSAERGRHLSDVHVPMLFVQGTRDALAELPLLQPLCTDLGEGTTLKLLQDADHSFHVLARSGRTNAEVRREILDCLDEWIDQVISRSLHD